MAVIVIIVLVLAVIFKPVAAWIILIGWVFDALIHNAEKAETEKELKKLREEVATLQAQLEKPQKQSSNNAEKR